MPAEFPAAFADPLLDLNRCLDAADAPEDQALGRGYRRIFQVCYRKIFQVLIPMAFRLLSCGIILVGAGRT